MRRTWERSWGHPGAVPRADTSPSQPQHPDRAPAADNAPRAPSWGSRADPSTDCIQGLDRGWATPQAPEQRVPNATARDGPLLLPAPLGVAVAFLQGWQSRVFSAVPGGEGSGGPTVTPAPQLPACNPRGILFWRGRLMHARRGLGFPPPAPKFRWQVLTSIPAQVYEPRRSGRGSRASQPGRREQWVPRPARPWAHTAAGAVIKHLQPRRPNPG